MNGYICHYKGKRIEVCADTAYAAQLEAARQFKVKANKSYQVAVVLAERNGAEVVHTELP